MDTDRRYPLVRFNPEPLRPFIKDRRVLNAELYRGGKNNSNYRVTLSDGTVFAARFYGAATPSGEAAALRLAAELIPVPAILYEGDTCIALSVMPGEPLSQTPRHCALAAQALARLGAIKFSRPGMLNKNGEVTPWNFGGGQTDFTAVMLAHPAVCTWLGPDRIKRIKTILARETDRLALLAETPQLVHGDFNPGNILVHNGTVSGVLDWEYAHSGSRYMDIANLLRGMGTNCAKDIERGMADGGAPLPADWLKLCALIDLSSHLEFLTSARADAFKTTRVSLTDKFILEFEAD